MDLEYCREFTVLISHKSYASAARELHLSQPSLSRHIMALEKYLGCALFYDTQPLTLTSAGETFARYAGRAISEHENMLAEVRALSLPTNAPIRVQDLLHTNALYVGLKDVIEQAEKKFGSMRVEYLNMSGSGLDPYDMVSKGKVDVSFQTTIFSESTTTLEVPEGLQAIWIPEFHGELVIGVAKNSGLASRECVALCDLSGERFILQAALHAELFRKQFIAMCHEEGFYPNITLVASDNPFDFYGSDPGDGIHLLAHVDKAYRPLISSILKQRVNIVRFADRKRYVESFAIVKESPESEEMQFLAERLKRHADEMTGKLER